MMDESGPLKFRFEDKSGQVINKADLAIDMALANMALDVERLSKMKVPVRMGLLRASGRTVRLGVKHLIVEYNKAYAHAQEVGKVEIGGKFRYFRNYSTPGTGKHYLLDSGNTVKAKSKAYLKEAIQRFL